MLKFHSRHLAQIKEEKSLDEINKRMADLAAKGDSTLQKTMMKWGAQQAEQLLSVVFTSMKEYTMNAKMEKTLGSLNAQTEAAFAKAMLAFGTQSDSVLYKLTFEGSARCIPSVEHILTVFELVHRFVFSI